MKVAIVLFGLFAVSLASSSPEARNVVTDLASAVIGKAESELAMIENGMKSLASSTLSAAESIMSKARNQVDVVIASLESTFDSLITKGGEAKTCALNQLTQFNQIKATVTNNLNHCTEDLSDKIRYSQEDVSDLIGDLKSSISQLTGFVAECVSKVFDALICAISHINPAKNIIDGVISDATTALSNAQSNVKQSLVTIEGCAMQIALTSVSQLNNIGANLKSCV